ncbi:hypothetical protein ARMSODRAFT_606164 [Armillaria solidipes]|uniref:Uncharacterized protein n=1 Tax=Armillaria solidipes TaxID=1076256 RepID=A0A2H3AUP2_9AGAR|nr:hypothetical protein ARMSODRAFT_606164 [Armillaria solidipes]
MCHLLLAGESILIPLYPSLCIFSAGYFLACENVKRIYICWLSIKDIAVETLSRDWVCCLCSLFLLSSLKAFSRSGHNTLGRHMTISCEVSYSVDSMMTVQASIDLARR